MTKKDLSDFRHLKSEIKMLDKEINELSYDIVSDTVRGSSKSFPYVEHTITITGLDTQGHDAKARRLKARLERRKADLLDKRAELEADIEAIDDSLLRQVITMRYINGMHWPEIAAHIGGGNSADSVRKQCTRFIARL